MSRLPGRVGSGGFLFRTEGLGLLINAASIPGAIRLFVHSAVGLIDGSHLQRGDQLRGFDLEPALVVAVRFGTQFDRVHQRSDFGTREGYIRIVRELVPYLSYHVKSCVLVVRDKMKHTAKIYFRRER